MSLPSYSSHPGRRHILTLIVIVLVIYALIPQLGDFHNAWQLLRRPSPIWLTAAIGLTFITYAAAALTYCLLALQPLRYRTTLLIQLAATFINRLLPAGVGALGVNYAYLRRQRFSTAGASSMIAINDLLGLIGHGLLVAITLIVVSGRDQPVSPSFDHITKLAWFVAATVIVILVVLAIAGRHRPKKFMADLWTQLRGYVGRPWRLAAALISSMLLTSANVLCLACSALALGVHLPFVAILLVFTFGAGIAAATPTPGGLGGFEAGLAAGLIAYHVSSADALAVALLFRLVSYWLTLAVGAVAFMVARRQKLLTT